MAGINKLTVIKLKSAKVGEKLQDGGGLLFIKTVSGGNWKFRYSFRGKRREMGLGSFPAVSLADARGERLKWDGVKASGTDPLLERQRLADEAARKASHEDPTFEEMLELTFETLKDRLRNDRARRHWLSPLKHHVIPKLGHMRISRIHQRDIHAALAPIWKTKHETADKALYRSRKVFHHARLSGFDVDPFVCDAARHMLGHVDYVGKPIPATPWQEIPDLFRRLDMKHPSYLALRWLILTAVRGESGRGARFSEIEGDTWTVPSDRMKGLKGKVSDFRVPLSTAAMDVLEDCRSVARNDFLFPSPRVSFVTGQACTKILNRMEEPGRLHGFRTSFRTWVQDHEAASYDVTETALAHIIGNKVERSYARSDLLDQRRILMQKWGDYVTQTEARVVQLRGRK